MIKIISTGSGLRRETLGGNTYGRNPFKNTDSLIKESDYENRSKDIEELNELMSQFLTMDAD